MIALGAVWNRLAAADHPATGWMGELVEAGRTAR
jgi:hypothetical protein